MGSCEGIETLVSRQGYLAARVFLTQAAARLFGVVDGVCGLLLVYPAVSSPIAGCSCVLAPASRMSRSLTKPNQFIVDDRKPNKVADKSQTGMGALGGPVLVGEGLVAEEGQGLRLCFHPFLFLLLLEHLRRPRPVRGREELEVAGLKDVSLSRRGPGKWKGSELGWDGLGCPGGRIPGGPPHSSPLPLPPRPRFSPRSSHPPPLQSPQPVSPSHWEG